MNFIRKIQWRVQEIRCRIRHVKDYLVGEWYCARFHRPLFADLGGYGGSDVWGRRRREYYGRWCVKCDRRWEKNGSMKKLTPSQEKACSEALGNMWVGGKGESEPLKPHLLALTPSEVEQLLAIWIHNLTFAGDLISSHAEKSLREHGLVAQMEGWAVVTDEGESWLRASGLAYKFKKMSRDVR